MNDLQKLLKLRGIDVIEVARAIGENYHSVQKVVKGRRHTLHTQEAVANYLGIARKEAFGRQSRLSLRRLLRVEINKKQKKYGQSLQRRYCLR